MSGGNISGEISPGENVQIPLSYEPGKTNERTDSVQCAMRPASGRLHNDNVSTISALTEKSAKFT